MPKLIVEFYSDLDEIAIKRANVAIRGILNALDIADIDDCTRSKIRKIVIDEVNGLKRELLEYFKRTKDGDI